MSKTFTEKSFMDMTADELEQFDLLEIRMLMDGYTVRDVMALRASEEVF